MGTFRIPASPTELLDTASEVYLTVQSNVAVASLSVEDIQTLADGAYCSWKREHQILGHNRSCLSAGVVYDLVSDTALCILKQQRFDSVFCLVRYAAFGSSNTSRLSMHVIVQPKRPLILQGLLQTASFGTDTSVGQLELKPVSAERVSVSIACIDQRFCHSQPCIGGAALQCTEGICILLALDCSTG